MTAAVPADGAAGGAWRHLLPALPSAQTVLVALMTAAQLLLAALVGHPFVHAAAADGWLTLPWWAIALGFAISEACLLHIQLGREAQAISISELPLVLGLFFTAPVQLLAGRLLGTALNLVVYRRSSFLKLAWNLAAVSLQTCVAIAVFRLVADGYSAHNPMTWAGAYAAVLLANVVTSVGVSLVVAIFEGGLSPRAVARDIIMSEPLAPLVVTFGLVAVGALTASPAFAVLLLLVGGGLLLAYRGYASLAERHLSLERLYRFTQAVSSSPEVDEVLGNVLQEAKELLRSESAEVLVLASTDGAVARVRLGASDRLSRAEEPQSPQDAWLLAHVVTDGESLLLPRSTREIDHRGWLAAHAVREAIAVPLKGSAGVIGALVVTDRLGDVRSFDDDDVLLLETVANHASVALQNGELIDKLRHEAMHDALTGLGNRVQLQRRLVAALDDVADGRSPGLAVMILNLDRFKEVNDTLGHEQGDLLLVEVGARMSTAVGATGVVARLGADEFAVLLAGIADEDRVVRMGRRILRALEQPIALDGMEVEVGGALGIALSPRHASDPAALLKRADIAMSDAKASTRGLRIYEPDLEAQNPQRLTLVAELRTALNNGDIQVYVQPQARLADGKVIAAEALVRWEHPELGFISPEEFIPVAERSGLIGPLTTHVLDRSLAAVAAWRRVGRDLTIAVNLSARSLHDADLVEEVRRLLRRHDVSASSLTLEVTEGSVMADPARAIALLHQLREIGVRLSVDDFGTGYSSLSYLKRLPVQEVKVDRSFVTGMSQDGEDAAIVRAIVDLGRHLGLEIVAEGVEDQATWDLLDTMGCNIMQGWHLARAMPVVEFLAWLNSRDAQRVLKPALRIV